MEPTSQPPIDLDASLELANKEETPSFWRVALSWHGSATPRVIKTALIFCVYAFFIDVAHFEIRWPAFDITPFEVFGAILGVLIVFRTNAGYDRWWEARKIWGGIVNQSRNLVLVGLEFGPEDQEWRNDLAKWVSAFSYCCKIALRDSTNITELESKFTRDEFIALTNTKHRPLYVASQIAVLTRTARSQGSLDGYAFLEMEKHRALLIDYIGACERIRKTPMPLVYAIKVRRLILLFLLTLPVAMAPIGYWISAITTFFVAYPLLSLDLIGMQLQNPFNPRNLSHLPLQDICDTIYRNLHELLDKKNCIVAEEGVYSPTDSRALSKKVIGKEALVAAAKSKTDPLESEALDP